MLSGLKTFRNFIFGVAGRLLIVLGAIFIAAGLFFSHGGFDQAMSIIVGAALFGGGVWLVKFVKSRTNQTEMNSDG